MDEMFDRLFQEMPLRLTVFLGHGRELFIEFGVVARMKSFGTFIDDGRNKCPTVSI